MNVVVVFGALSRAPEVRELPSGDRLASFEVTVRTPDQPTESVPVVWFDPPDRALRLAAGAEVVVTGKVRRRFFRTPAGTGSRTEVVASQVLPATQRKRVQAAVGAELDVLAGAIA
ncbi:single-stranded DNA-binding protein [Aquihabitans sp. McL0605]|uniref:single-stranded DNA-binding protein n=1 Tax=Aquihabitans sp. McL0605 TaxID=3415671 RepID=UPI003CF568F5